MKTIDDGVQAPDSVRDIVSSICADHGLPEAHLRMVDKIDGSALNAEFKPNGGSPTIYLTRRASLELTDAALRWLIAHEIGHYWYDRPWRATYTGCSGS